MIQLTFPDDCEIIRYPGGESQVRLRPELIPVLEFNVTVTARVRSANDLIELALFIDAIDGVALSNLKLILPYLPYARADRRFLPGDCLGIAVMAQIISGVLAPAKIESLDVHSLESHAEIVGLRDVSPEPLIRQAITHWGASTMLLFPDEGAKIRYGSMFPEWERFTYHATKQRDPVTGKLSGFRVPAELKGHPEAKVLIIDDICDGGGTFLGIADELGLPAERLALYVSHGIFSKGFHELNKRFGKIYTTNSFAPWTSDERFRVFDCLPLLKGESQ